MTADTPIESQGEENPPPGLYKFDKNAEKRVPTIDDISETDLGFFQENGYLIIDDFLNTNEINDAIEGMLELLGDAHSGNGDLPDNIVNFEEEKLEAKPNPESLHPEQLQDYVRKFWRFSQYNNKMRAPSEKDNLIDLLSTLVGGEPEMFQDMALTKPPGGGEKPWHQDKAYFSVELDAPVVGVWIALDEAHADNGCMHIIPGSHKDGPVVHFDRRDWQICDTDVQTGEDVMATLKPGGALLFDGLIHHGTPPNTSDDRRRALQFHYTAEGATWLDDNRPPEFGNTDKDVEC